MAFPLLEQCLDKIVNRYLLVVLSAKRSRQLNRGSTPQVESRRKKWTSVALEEVIAGKVQAKPHDEETKAGASVSAA